MKTNIVLANVWRFVLYFVFQTVVCMRVDLSIGNFNYMHLLLYPIPVIMLPMKTPKSLILIIAFIYGMAIDGFYNTPGVHTAALVFTAYIRSLVLLFLEPFEGYTSNDYATIHTMGLNWFISYTSILLLMHCFLYFSIDAFSFVYFFDIFMNTVFSFIVSISLALLFQFIFRPKY